VNDPAVANAVRLIHENSPASEAYDVQSFVGRLDEECVFDAVQFRALEAALVCVSGHDEVAVDMDRHVFRIYRQLALDFACHRDPNDVYTVENIDTDKALDLMNRIDFVFQCYFDRTEPDVDDWDDGAYAAAQAEAQSLEPNPRPDWMTRGKSIRELITELETFDDDGWEVRLSFDMGATHYPISLVYKMTEGVVMLTTVASELTVETDAPTVQSG